MGVQDGVRPLDPGVRTDLRSSMSYRDYLELGAVLDSQHPRSDPPHADELVFIIQHQVTELWLKLALHELRRARAYLDVDELQPAMKSIARVKHVQRSLIEQWSVLATLTPNEFVGFRNVLGTASGFQSFQYRAVEFLLGNKDSAILPVFEHEPVEAAGLEELLHEPTLYDVFLHHLARAGYAVPGEVLERDVTQAWVLQPALIPVFRTIYESTDSAWSLYQVCEDLVDLEDNFQEWRFRHLRTVARIIGHKEGTGGSSGVGFLRQALDLTFFPELFAVRTEIGAR